MRKTHYNEIDIRTVTAEKIQSISGLGIQILVDGTVYTDGDDYYVNVDSFFEALAQQSAVIEFIGGCHHPPCCANGAWTNLSPMAWCWNNSKIRLRWIDVHRVARSMLEIIEEHAEQKQEVWCAKHERMPFYREQLIALEKRANEASLL